MKTDDFYCKHDYTNFPCDWSEPRAAAWCIHTDIK